MSWLRGAAGPAAARRRATAGRPGRYRRAFDMLIVDEAHHVAPAAPQQVYAVDSQQTKPVRELAEKCDAPPVPQRHPAQRLPRVVHRPAGDDRPAAVRPRGRTRPGRGQGDRGPPAQARHRREEASGIPERRSPRRSRSSYPDEERRSTVCWSASPSCGAASSTTGTAPQGRRPRDAAAQEALILQPGRVRPHGRRLPRDRCESSGRPTLPATTTTSGWRTSSTTPPTYEEEQLAEAEDDALGRAAPDAARPPPTRRSGSCERMSEWAHDARGAARLQARELIDLPDGGVPARRRTLDQRAGRRLHRVPRHLDWLADLLRQEGLAATGWPMQRRRHHRRASASRSGWPFQSRSDRAPGAHPARHRRRRRRHRPADALPPAGQLRHPVQPEQAGAAHRPGRPVRPDHKPEVRHFVGTGCGRPVDAYEADLEFLARVATKVARMERDLGAVNAVLADAVQRRMLGEAVDIDVATAGKNTSRDLPIESNVGAQVRRLRAHLDETVQQLGITPAAVKRVVDTALELARQQPLRRYVDEKYPMEGLYEVPPLTGSWQRATAGLTEKLERPDGQPRQLPVTFDPAVRKGRATRSCPGPSQPPVGRHVHSPAARGRVQRRHRAAPGHRPGQRRPGTGGRAGRGVLAVRADRRRRVRLHEEVLYAGGWAPAQGRFRRLENRTVLGGMLERAFARAPHPHRWCRHGSPSAGRASPTVCSPRSSGARGPARSRCSGSSPSGRPPSGSGWSTTSNSSPPAYARHWGQIRRSRRTRCSAAPTGQVEKSTEELAQYRRDRQSWEERLSGLEAERDRELKRSPRGIGIRNHAGSRSRWCSSCRGGRRPDEPPTPGRPGRGGSSTASGSAWSK